MTAFVTEVCGECGNLKSVCSDPDVRAYPQRSYCYFSAGVAQTWRRTWAMYDHPDPKSERPHETDGLKWWLALEDLTPEDNFFVPATGLGASRPPAPNGETDYQ